MQPLSGSTSIMGMMMMMMMIMIIIITIIYIIELTHSKTILQSTVEIEPQPVAVDFRNLS